MSHARAPLDCYSTDASELDLGKTKSVNTGNSIQAEQHLSNDTASPPDPEKAENFMAEQGPRVYDDLPTIDGSQTDPEKAEPVQTEKNSQTDDRLSDDATSPTISPSPSPHDPHTYPEGGLRAWLVTFGAWAAMVSGLGLVNTIGPLQAYVASHQLKGYSESSISWIFSIFVFLVFFCGLQIGPVFDAMGPRWLIAGGSVLTVGGLVGLAECTEYWHFILAFSIVCGVGSSLLFTPAVAAVSHYFSARRSFATGFACTGGAAGGVLFPLTLQSLLPRLGYPWAIRTIALISLFFCVLANLLVRSRLPPARKGSRTASVLPDLRIFLDGDGALALVTAGTFFMEFGLFVPITYLTSYLLASGVPEAFSYQVIPILSGASAFGRWVPGLAADRLGRFNVMIAMLAVCTVTTFALWLPAGLRGGSVVPLVVVYAVLFGFASGSNISLTPTCVGQLCDTSEYGRYYATCYTIVSFATLTGIPIAGALIQAAGGEYYGLIVFTGCCYIASLACFVAVRVRRAGWGWRVAW